MTITHLDDEPLDTLHPLDLLERAVADRAPFTTYINRWPELDLLAGEPRFRAVLQRIGLPEAVKP